MRLRTALIGLMAASLLLTAGCEPASSAYTGTVVADDATLVMPALPTPRVALDPDAARTAPSVRTQPDSVAASTSLGTRFRVQDMRARVGDRVTTGQVLAVVDTSLLDAEIVSARAAARVARAQVGAIDSRTRDVSDNRATVADKRAEVKAAIARLTSTRADLVAKLAQAKAAYQKLLSMTPPPGSIPPSMTPPGGFPDPGALKSAIAKLEAGIARIDEGLAQARSGLAKLDSAGATLDDADAALDSARALAEAGADALDSAVAVPVAVRDLCILRSPADGVVVSAVRAGAVLAPGAPLLTVRENGARRVKTWVPVDVADAVAVGDDVRVTFDSLGPLEGHVTLVGTDAEFPPTTLATREIHMTRAIAVEVTLDSSATPPPGTPADLSLKTE